MNFPFGAIGETALDEWQCLFQRDFRCRCQQQMEVIEEARDGRLSSRS
jgi:hypothetical protein